VFETLFKYPCVIARHRAGASVEARELFLNHCASQGLAGATLLRHARELLVIAERIDITSGEPISLPAIEAAADHWARKQHSRHRVQSLHWSRKLFVQTATSWLHFLGVWRKSNPRWRLLRTALSTSPLTSAMSAVYPRPLSAVRDGMWRSF